jgi:bla regulator protein blaR1
MELFNETHIWIVALGKTIVHSIWIGLLIMGLLRLVLYHISVKFSNLRYGISVSALFLLICSLIAAFIIVYEPAALHDSFSSGRAISPLSLNLLLDSNGKTLYKSTYLFSVFSYMYFAGTVFMLFRFAVSLKYVRSLRRSGTGIDQEWQTRFSGISRSLGIRRSIELLESHHVTSPLLIGFFKPAVIVPAGMITHLPLDQIETILLHELYHLKRRDHLVNIMQLFLEGILFYNPAVWIISTYIRNEREHCCDDEVIHSTNDPVIYARALIHIAEEQQFSRLSPGAVGSTKDQFSSRIRRILNRNNMKTNMRDKVIALALMAGSVIVLLTISAFSVGPSFARFNNMNEELSTPVPEYVTMALADTIPQKSKAIKEEIEQEIEDAINEAMEDIEDIDWEEIREEMEKDMESVRAEIEDIDWEEVKVDLEQSMLEMKIDMEEMKIEIENSMKEINWEEIEKELEKAKIHIDSLKIELER